MKILHTIYSGEINLGKIVLSPNFNENSFLCYSSIEDEGIVKIYETIYPKNIKNIKAHKSPIMKIAINNNGDRLATCSVKGTIIRIFSLPKGEKIFTFKRGINSTFIYCMNFNQNSEKLILSCDTGIFHVFNLNTDKNNENRGIIKNIERISVTILSYIFSDYEDSFGNKGANLSYKNDNLKISNLISFNSKNESEIFMFTSDGYYILFNINDENDIINKKFQINIKDIN
jgi:WD40 repeat protein